MKLLLVGGSKVDNAANVLTSRFPTMDVATTQTIEDIISRGKLSEHYERVLVFEQAMTADGTLMEGNAIRKRAQDFIGALREAFKDFDIVAVGDSHLILSLMSEELFEIKHRAVVAEVRAKAMTASILSALASKTVSELKTIYKEVGVNDDIYRKVDSVIWSTEATQEQDWGSENEQSGAHVRLGKNVHYDVLTGQLIDDSAQDEEPVDVGESADKKNGNDKGKKRFGLFGNRKV